jgi:hypothetical protein
MGRTRSRSSPRRHAKAVAAQAATTAKHFFMLSLPDETKTESVRNGGARGLGVVAGRRDGREATRESMIAIACSAGGTCTARRDHAFGGGDAQRAMEIVAGIGGRAGMLHAARLRRNRDLRRRAAAPPSEGLQRRNATTNAAARANMRRRISGHSTARTAPPAVHSSRN